LKYFEKNKLELLRLSLKKFKMNKTRLEAFSDGVLAIIITIMVLEIKIPVTSNWEELVELLPIFISYVLSFTFVGIYWGSHHHLMQVVKKISTGIIWANLNLLFWLSLIPFGTGWMGETHFSQNAVIFYAVLLMFCGAAYYILQKRIEKNHLHEAHLGDIFKKQSRKGIVSLVLYSVAIIFAFLNPIISGVIFFAVAAMWIVPDRNIERLLDDQESA
jgi:uncharacterized membrane protein